MPTGKSKTLSKRNVSMCSLKGGSPWLHKRKVPHIEMNCNLKTALNDSEYLSDLMEFHTLGGLWTLPGGITSYAASCAGVAGQLYFEACH